MFTLRPRRSNFAALLVPSAAALAALGCAGIASPDGWASPVVEDDIVVVAHEDKLFGFDSSTLDARWAFPGVDDDIDLEALYGTPAVTEGAVFVPTYDETLFALDRETGEALWPAPFETDGPIVGGVLATADRLYFGSSGGELYALDFSGQPVWSEPFEADDSIWATPALAGDTLFVTSLDSRLYALDVATGAERWSFSTDAGIASPPVVDEAAGVVYIAGFDSMLRAIDIETHQERWSFEADNWFWTEPLVAGDIVYAGALDSTVYAVDASTGELRWPSAFPTEAPVRSAPLLVAGVLIVVDRDGNVYGINPSDGSPAADKPLELEDDVLADPKLAARGGDGDVLIVTTGGDLLIIDASELDILERRPLGS